MSPSTEKEDAADELSKLAIRSGPKKQEKAKSKVKQPVADSWEDEDLSDEDEAPANENGESLDIPSTPGKEDFDESPSRLKASTGTTAPPPTPASALSTSGTNADTTWPPSSDYGYASPTSTSTLRGEGAPTSRRPEKTDAVARRMIAAGLGLKAPRQTEEQRAYQKSVREQEKKRREQERAEQQKQKEETERAKAAVWDD